MFSLLNLKVDTTDWDAVFESETREKTPFILM